MTLLYHCIMLRKIFRVCIEALFPKSHMQEFLETASLIHFLSFCATKPQLKQRMFHPFDYKNNFIKDCIIELKERNMHCVAKHVSIILSDWIIREIINLKKSDFNYCLLL